MASVASPISRWDSPRRALGEFSTPMAKPSTLLMNIDAAAARSAPFSWATMVLMTGYWSSASWKSMAMSTFSRRMSSMMA